jgi:hypothetical protein
MLNGIAELGLTDEQLEEYAARIGADCAFFIKNVPAYATGIGNILTPTGCSISGYCLVLVKPDIHISTKEAYSLVRPAARETAKKFLARHVPENVPADGASPNLWVVGVTVYPYCILGMPGGSSGPGMGGFTAKLFMDWWDFSRDDSLLAKEIWPTVSGVGDFLLRSTRDYDGKRLAVFSASPER